LIYNLRFIDHNQLTSIAEVGEYLGQGSMQIVCHPNNIF